MISLIERFLLILLGLVLVAVFTGGIFIMVSMDRGSVGQGGRFYVAVITLVVLTVVDSQIEKILKRRLPFSLGTTPQEVPSGMRLEFGVARSPVT